MSTSSASRWSYLAPKPGSAYRQLFVKGTRIAARILYGLHVNEEEPMTLEEIATAYNLPLDAVREAVAYCQSNPPEIQLDWEREEAHMQARAASDSRRGATP
jgi:uncharacterized protein (DUF433 family)